MRATVLGSGAGALAIAADLSRHGRETIISDLPQFLQNLDSVRERKGIVAVSGWEGSVVHRVEVADDLATAVQGSDIVIVAVPSFGHEPFIDALAPILNDGQILLFFGEGSGSLVARRSLVAAGRSDVLIGETNTLPYMAKAIRSGIVRAEPKAGGVFLAGLPANIGDELFHLVEGVWPYISVAECVWETILCNFNAIDHVATVLCNVGTLENRSGGMLLWGEGATPSVVRIIEKVDTELLEIRRALGLSNQRRYRDFLVEQGFASNSSGDLYDTIRGSLLVGAYVPTGPDALRSRYITEDVPYALVLLSSIAGELGVDTPVVDGLISIASALADRDFRGEGRTLEKLGLAGLGREGLLRYGQEGELASAD